MEWAPPAETYQSLSRSSISVPNFQLEALRDAFSLLDPENTGLISVSAFYQAFHALGHDTQAPELQEFFRTFEGAIGGQYNEYLITHL